MNNQVNTKGLLVWTICALFFLYEFFIRTVIGTFQHPLMIDLNLNSFQFSIISTTVFFIVYGLMQIPVGLIVDHIGLKKSLLIGSTCCMISSFGFASSHSFELAFINRMFMGFGASFGFVGLLISVHDWMPHKYSAIFIGLSQFIGTLGPMVAAGPLDSISESSDVTWRAMFLALAAIGFVLSILILLFVENNSQKAGKYTILYKPEKVLTSIKRLFSRSQPWYIAIVSVCLYFTIEYLSENEGRAFLMLKGISLNSASYMITIAWIGYAIGCPMLGFISDTLSRRKIMMQICAVLGLVSIILILYAHSTLIIQIAFFCLGISASGQSIGFATIAEQFKKQFVAVGFGLNNAVITIMAAVNAPLMGYVLDRIKTGETPSLQNYLSVFNILILMAVIGVVTVFFFIKETFCKSAVEFTVVSKNL